MRLLSIEEVTFRTSLSRTFINRLRSEGQFPVAVAVGDKRISFVESEVEDWMQQRINDRDSKLKAQEGLTVSI
ncbi:MAG: AlpA family phage regulatory protein [Pseudomonadota bacterium]